MPGYASTAMYHFEETQGATLLDAATSGRGGTLEGGRRSEGYCGRALRFDVAGAHAYLAAMGSLFGNGLAVSVWLRPASIDAGLAHIVGDGGGGLSSFQLVLEGGVPSLHLSDDFGQWHEMLRSDAPLVAGIWQHIVVRYEPGASSGLFVDGTEGATTDVVRSVPGSYNRLVVGALNDLDTGFYHQYLGDLDELAIFAR